MTTLKRQKPVASVVTVVALLALAGCSSLRPASTELEPLPPELQGRVIASVSTTSEQRLSERGIGPGTTNGQVPQTAAADPNCDPDEAGSEPLPDNC